MRVPFGIWACLLVLACLVQAAETVSAQNLPCQTPDESLLPQGGAPDDEKIALYNQQVRRFAACARQAPVDAQIERLRMEAGVVIRKISETANAQIADIQAKMEMARTGTAAGAASQAPPDGLSFPAPECKEADRSLLEPKRQNGKIIRSLDVISPEYEEQDRKHKACVETYIRQAFAELKQIGSAAEAQIAQVRDDVNGRIARLAASGKVSPAAGAPLALSTGAVNWRDGVESVTVEGQRLRQSQDTPKGEGDPDIIACRAPQQLPYSRLQGPEICKRNRDWAALYKIGMDISSDGTTVVPSEKARSTGKAGLNCIHSTVGGLYEEHITNEICY
jgi:hypothetical protein